MSKVSKEFWVSDDFMQSISSGKTFNPISMGLLKEDPDHKNFNKITVSYEIDREVTIKESDLRKAFDVLEFSERDFGLIKQRIFGGGENG